MGKSRIIRSARFLTFPFCALIVGIGREIEPNLLEGKGLFAANVEYTAALVTFSYTDRSDLLFCEIQRTSFPYATTSPNKARFKIFAKENLIGRTTWLHWASKLRCPAEKCPIRNPVVP